jgi:hypothetical protein
MSVNAFGGIMSNGMLLSAWHLFILMPHLKNFTNAHHLCEIA